MFKFVRSLRAYDASTYSWAGEWSQAVVDRMAAGELLNVELNCGDNGDAAAAAAATALTSPHCRVAKLSFDSHAKKNAVKADGAAALAAALKENKSVTELSLANMDVGDAGAVALAEVLGSNRTLGTLSLYNSGVENDGAAALAEGLKVSDFSHFAS